jgi:hypothetical protein
VDTHCAGLHLCLALRRFELEGVRRTVDAVLLVAEHGHPHVLLLQVCGVLRQGWCRQVHQVQLGRRQQPRTTLRQLG